MRSSGPAPVLLHVRSEKPSSIVAFASTLVGLLAGGCTLSARGDSGGRTDLVADAPLEIGRAAPSPPPPPRTTIFVTAGEVEVRERPALGARAAGILRAGGFARATGERFTGDDRCPGGWAAVEPTGFLCENGATTRDPEAPAVTLLEEYRLAGGAALPASYGFAQETPVYLRVPTWDEQVRSEPGLSRRSRRQWTAGGTAAGHESREPPDNLRTGVFAPFSPKPAAPGSPVTGALAPGAPVAWVAEFETAGRTWVLTPDLLFVPRDRVQRAIVSAFHGSDVPPGSRPAFVRTKRAFKYQYQKSSHGLARRADSWPLGAVVLVPAGATPDVLKGKEFLPTLDPEIYVQLEDVNLAAATSGSRWGIDQGDRWLEVNAAANVLFAHEGPSVVFATLVSVGGDLTPRGKFRIVAKHLTLSPPFDGMRHRGASGEVPHVLVASERSAAGKVDQESPAFALYAGWWLSSWGQPARDPGVALSPLDARRLVDWTAPTLPEGWQAILRPGTWIVVHD